MRNRESGWSNIEKLIWENGKILERLQKITSTDSGLTQSAISDLNTDIDTVNTTLVSIETLLTGTQRTPSLVEATTNGSTIAGVQSVTLLFLGGSDGTLNGVTVPENSSFSFSSEKDNDSLGSIAYTVPTAGRVLISYIS